MRETITVNRITDCPLIVRQVAQQISAYSLIANDGQQRCELLTKYCSGQSICQSLDCQFTVGLQGKAYTKSFASIYKAFE